MLVQSFVVWFGVAASGPDVWPARRKHHRRSALQDADIRIIPEAIENT